MKKIPDYPFIVYLQKSGKLCFCQDLKKYESIKKKSVDIWVMNNRSQTAEIRKCQRLFIKNNLLEKITPAKFSRLKSGTQIIYLPQHLVMNADILNTEIQFGFITSKKEDKNIVFCRYYSNYELVTLRTLSCSESVGIESLYMLNTMSSEIVKYWLLYIDDQDKKYSDVKESVWQRLQR